MFNGDIPDDPFLLPATGVEAAALGAGFRPARGVDPLGVIRELIAGRPVVPVLNGEPVVPVFDKRAAAGEDTLVVS